MTPREMDPAGLLLRKAAEDLDTVLMMVAVDGFAVEIVGFHAQQCCEKAFKAVLAHRGIRYPFTHDLIALVDLLRDSGVVLPDVAEDAPTLTPFAVVYRYEDLDLGDAPATEWIVTVATSIHSWATDAVDPGPPTS